MNAHERIQKIQFATDNTDQHRIFFASQNFYLPLRTQRDKGHRGFASQRVLATNAHERTQKIQFATEYTDKHRGFLLTQNCLEHGSDG